MWRCKKNAMSHKEGNLKFVNNPFGCFFCVDYLDEINLFGIFSGFCRRKLHFLWLYYTEWCDLDKISHSQYTSKRTAWFVPTVWLCERCNFFGDILRKCFFQSRREVRGSEDALSSPPARPSSCIYFSLSFHLLICSSVLRLRLSSLIFSLLHIRLSWRS